MANVFDQFDAPAGNPFDKFDAPAEPNAGKTPAQPPMMTLSEPDASGRRYAIPTTDYNKPEQPTGIGTRMWEGMKAPYEEPLGFSQENLQKYPTLGWLQEHLPHITLGDAVLRAPSAVIGGLTGAAAGLAEPLLGRSWADRLQRDLNLGAQAAAPEVPMEAGALPLRQGLRAAQLDRTPLRRPVEPPPIPAEPPPLVPRQVPRPQAGVDLLPADTPHTLPPERRSLGAAGAGGPLANTSPETIQYMRQVMEEQGFTPHTIDQRLGELSEHHMFGEITPSLEADMGAIAAPPGPGKLEVMNSLRQRAVEARERVQHVFDRAFGVNENLAQLKRTMVIDRQRAADPFYERFKQTVITPSPAIEALMPRLQASGALQAANRKLAVAGEPAARGFPIPGEPPTMQYVPTASAFQYAKEALDDRITRAVREGEAGDARLYVGLQHDLLDALDTHPQVGDVWRQARSTYAAPTEIMKAADFGQQVLTSKIHPDELPFLTAGYSAPQMAAMRLGMRNHLENVLGKRDALMAEAINTALSPNNIQKMRWAIGDEATEQLVNAMEAERHMHTAPTRVHGGSPTALRLEAQKRWTVQPAGPGMTLQDMAHAAHKPVRTALKKGVEKVAEHIGASKRRELEARMARMREEAARIFTLQGPERDAVARYLVNPEEPLPARKEGGRVNDFHRARHAYTIKKQGGGELSDEDQAAMMPETFNPISGWTRQAAQKDVDTIKGVAGGVRDMVTAPRRLMQPNPYPEGTEEASWYEDQRQKDMLGSARDMALSTMGTGAIAGLPLRAGEVALGAGPIRAYHGSPHQFDRFSMEHIGTGEGAQTYGHGLYFAEHEPVAQTYRDQMRWKGANWDDPHVLAQNAIDRLGDRASAADSLQSALDSTTRFHRGKVPASQAEANAVTQRAIDLLRNNEPINAKPPTPGRMYEVAIDADPEHLLDWDKPLSQQSPHVQKVLEQFGYKAQPEQMRAFDDALLEALNTDKNVKLPKQPHDPHGRDIYTLGRLGNPATASQRLRDAGIPGIKYLDQGSRAAKEGTRNYVMFDDRPINVLRSYQRGGRNKFHQARYAFIKKQGGGELDPGESWQPGQEEQPAPAPAPPIAEPPPAETPQINQPFGELKPYYPRPTERFTHGLQDLMMTAGANPYSARHMAEGLTGVAGIAPPIGVGMSMADLISASQRRDIGAAIPAAIGAIPMAGRARGAKKAIEEAVTAAEEAFHPSQLAEKYGEIGTHPAERALTVNDILHPDTPAMEARSRNVEDIAHELNQRGAAALRGLDVPESRILGSSPRTDELISRALASEVKSAIERGGNTAQDWYTKAIDEAMQHAATIHPELANDPFQKMGFTAALAVTSQGETVSSNVRLAEQAYDYFKRNGRFPTDIKAKTGPAMNANFNKLNTLLDELGPEGTREFLHTPFTVRDLKKMGHDVGKENMDTKVYGSSILGPKIGGGFYQNLNGNYDPVTMDLWFMRGWGRLTGTLVGKPEVLPKATQRLTDAMREAGMKVPRNQDKLTEVANDVMAKHERDFRTNRADYDSGAKTKSELTLAADRYLANLRGINETPTSGSQREWMRARVNRARELLAEQGHNLTNADLQAIWWYPEKELYSKLGGRDSEAINTDYATVFRDLAAKRAAGQP